MWALKRGIVRFAVNRERGGFSLQHAALVVAGKIGGSASNLPKRFRTPPVTDFKRCYADFVVRNSMIFAFCEPTCEVGFFWNLVGT